MKGLGRGFIVLVFIFTICCFTQTALAQKEEEQKKDKRESSYSLDEITVSGKGVKEPVTSPYAVTESSRLQTEVFTREEIEALHPESVWDIIEQVPGMEVTFQGRQHMDFSSMRGTGSYGVILDGVYVPSLDRLLKTLPVDAIESMTVVRDATALTLGPLTNFGSNTGSGNQGFVIIKTKRAAKKLEGGFVASYGSFHTEKEHVYQGAKIGNFDYRIAGTYNNTLGKTNWYNASRNESLLFRGGYTAPVFNADVLYYSSRGMREFQRSETVAPSVVKGKLYWGNVGELSNAKWKIDPMVSDMFAINLSKPWNDVHTTTFSYAYNNLIVASMTTNFPDGSAKISVGDQNSRGQSASLRHVINARNNILKVGGQFLQAIAPDGSAPNIGRRSGEDMYGLYVQDEYHMLNDRLTIDGGVRVDKKHYENSPTTGNSVDEWAKETYACAFGASYKPGSIFTLTGRYAYTENSQSSYQASSDGTTLPPERRSRYETGVLANIHPAFNPWLTLYYYDTKNQKVSSTGIDPYTGKKVSSYTDPFTGEEVNFVAADDVVTKGLEFGISGQMLKHFSYRLQYTHVTTDNTDTNNSSPHHLASGRFSYKYKKFFANASLRYVSSYSRTLYDERGGYTRLDANTGYNFQIFDRDTRITLYGRNLGNKAYYTSGNGQYYDPGIQYGVELAYKFW
jgi:iron complex outermembrane receptor protein